MCFGYTDGTSHYCVTGLSEHNVDTTNTNVKGDSDEVVRSFTDADVLDGEAAFDSFITDGVRINWDTGTDASYHMFVILIGGNDGSYHSESWLHTGASPHSIDVPEPGFEPNFVISLSALATTLNSANTRRFISLGLTSNDGDTVLRGSLNCHSNHGLDTSALSQTLSVLYSNFNTADNSDGIELNTFDASGFTAELKTGTTGARIGYICGDLEGTSQSFVGVFDTPTSTGEQVYTGVGFQPDFCLVLYSAMTAEDSLATNDRAGTFGIAAWTPTTQVCGSITEEDAVGTTNTQSRFDGTGSSTPALACPDDSGNTLYAASLTSFDADGFTLNFPTVDSEARKFIVLAIGAAGTKILPSAGTITIAGLNPTIDQSTGEIIPDTGAITISGQAPDIDQAILPSVGTVTIAGQAPNIDQAITPSVGTVTIAGLNPEVDQTVLPSVGTVTIAGLAPEVDQVATPSVGTITIAGLAPEVDQAILPSVGTITIAGLNPEDIAQTLIMPVGTITITGLNPNVVQDATIIIPDVGTITISGLTAAVKQPPVTPSVGTITVAGLAPRVKSRVEFAVIAGVTNTSTGFQDFTEAGFGTPRAAIFVMFHTTDNTGSATDGVSMSYGFTDGTNQRCLTGVSEHAAANSNTNIKTDTDEVVRVFTDANVLDGEANFDSWITDGVRINWASATDAEYRMIVILIGGEVGSYHVNNFTGPGAVPNTVNVTDPGFEPTFILPFHANQTSADVDTTDRALIAGAISNDGTTIVQHSYGSLSEDGRPQARMDAIFETAFGTIDPSTVYSSSDSLEFKDFDTSGFTAESARGTPDEIIHYLCGNLTAASRCFVQTLDTPTSTGQQSYTGFGFKPDFCLVFYSWMDTVDVRTTDETAATFGVAAWTATNQLCGCVTEEDANTNMNTQTLFDVAALNAPDDTGAGGYQADFVSFDTDGFTLDFPTQVDTSARKFMVLAFGPGGTIFIPDPGTITIAGLDPTIDTGSTIIIPSVGTITIAGQAPDIDQAILPSVGTVTIAGLNPEVDQTITPSVGTVTIAGLAPEVDQAIIPSVGTITIAGLNPTVVQPATIITPDTGTITIAGQAPEVDQTVLPSVGTVTVTGLGADIDQNVLPSVGTVTITGQAPAVDQAITPSVGTITITGLNPDIDQNIIPSVGTVTIAGQAPDINQVVIPSVGTITIAGQAPDIDQAILPSVGTVTIAGQAPEILQGATIAPSVGTITIAGQAPEVDQAILPSVGTITIAGQAPEVDQAITPSVGTVTIAGLNPVLNQTILPSVGTITIAGQAPEIDQAIIPSVGTVTVAGLNPEVDQAIIPSVGTVTIAGQAPNIDQVAIPSVGTVTIAGLNPEILQGSTISPTIGIITISGQAPVLNQTILPSVGTVTIAGQAPEVNQAIIPSVGTVTITGQAPEVDQAIIPSVGTVTIAGQAPEVDQVATPSVGTVTIAGLNPEVDQTITPSVGTVTIAGLAPEVDQAIIPSVGTVTITGLNPTVVQPGVQTIIPDTGIITITGLNPTVDQAILPSVGTITIAGLNPEVNQVAIPSVGTVIIAGQAPEVDQAILPSVGTITITGLNPTVDQAILPSVGTVTITGLNPTVDQAILPSVGTITIAGLNPTVVQPVEPSVGTITITGLSPTVVQPDAQTIVPSVGTITMTGLKPADQELPVEELPVGELPNDNETALLTATFHSRDGVLPSIWSNSSSAFTTADRINLKAVSAGELIYTGTSLRELAKDSTGSDADFSIIVQCIGAKNAKFSIRGRRQDANNHISLSVDFSTNKLRIIETTAGTEVVLNTGTHTLRTTGLNIYTFGLWMQGSNLHARINAFEFITAVNSSFVTKNGFSIYVPEVNTSDPLLITAVLAHELKAQVAPSKEGDPSNLLVTFRKQIKETIEDPAERTWATFVEAINAYNQGKDVGFTNETWEELGYPIQRPTAEEWFG